MNTGTEKDSIELMSFWDSILGELGDVPAAAEETLIPLRSDEYSTCWGVRLTSLGDYRIFGYLSIPKQGSGPFPTFYELPRYQSVVEVVHQGLSVDMRRECVLFSIACRGQRNADSPLCGEFPGMLTAGADDPHSFPMVGWVADCLRGLEYLSGRPEVDAERIAGCGYNDFSLLTAALAGRAGAGRLCCVASNPGLFYRSSELAPKYAAYPIQEINDFCRCYPDRAAQLHRTLSLLDPAGIASLIEIPTLLWCGLPYGLLQPDDIRPLAEQISGECVLRVGTGSRSQDGIHQEEWLARQLQLPEAVLPEHWRS